MKTEINNTTATTTTDNSTISAGDKKMINKMASSLAVLAAAQNNALEIRKEQMEEAAKKRRMADQLAAAKARYAENGDPNSNGDDVAQMLKAMSLEKTMALADVICGETEGFHARKYANLNNGQKRMNSGNKIRNAIKKGANVKEALAKLA